MTDISLRYLLFGEDKTATSTIGKVGGAFSKVGSKIGGEFGEILNRVGEGIDHIGEHSKSMGAKLTGMGAIVGGVGVAFQLAGSKEKQATDQLNTAIDATGKAHQDYAEEVEKAIKSNEGFGFGAADTSNALAKLTLATNDPKKALDNMGVAANLAAQKHISLTDASALLARVLNGTGAKTLSQYGITMDKTKDKTAAGQAALDQLSGKLKGQAAASVDNFGGKLRVWQTRIGDVTAQMGQKLGPALTVAGPSIMAIGTIVELGVVPAMGKWIASTAVATAGMIKNAAIATVSAIRYGVVAAATGVWTAAQWALNVALNANPIALIIIGIAALIAVVILAWKHSETFRRIVTGAFHAVLSAASATWGWIKSHWPLLLAILTGPVGLAVLWIHNHWNTLVGFFKGMPAKIGAALGSVASFITAPFRAAFNYIADAWNNTVGRLHWSIPSWVPGLGGKSISVPQLPHFARGAIFNKPTVGVFAEAGPEAVIPLSAGRGGFGGGGDMRVEINFNGPVDKAAVGKQVTEALVEYQRQQRRPLPLSVAGGIG